MLSTYRLPTLCLALLCPAAAAQVGDTVYLPGAIRDFQKSHPDFAVTTDGHYAGNVGLTMGSECHPLFVGGGFEVLSDWHTGAGDPLAPHLFAGGPVVRLTNAPTEQPGSVLDTWDPDAGPYGPPNVGPPPGILLGAPMPAVYEPTGMGASVGDVVYNSDTTLGSNLHCDQLTIRNGKTLTISGDVTILCQELFEMKNSSSIELDPGATLVIYLWEGAELKNSEQLNANTGDYTRVTIVNLGLAAFDIKGKGTVYATIVSPNAELGIKANGDFFGSYTGADLYLAPNSGCHVVGVPSVDACGNVLMDTLGSAGPTNHGGITSASTFDEWYHDMMGVNLSAVHTIALVRNENDVFEFLSDAFHPLDGRLFGNEGESHNNNFTYTIATTFTYNACTGQFFEFEGNDDVWAFVDKGLVIDLGGATSVRQQHIDIDRLGLTDGDTYSFDFFYAQRQAAGSVFKMRTNLEFETQTPIIVSAGHD